MAECIQRSRSERISVVRTFGSKRLQRWPCRRDLHGVRTAVGCGMGRGVRLGLLLVVTVVQSFGEALGRVKWIRSYST